MRLRGLVILLLIVSAALAPAAVASQVVSTSTATAIKLGVDGKGRAFLSYKTGGKDVDILAWGAINAIAPTRGGRQVAFQLDYSGGYTLVKGDLAKATSQLRIDQGLFRNAQSAANAQGKKYSPDVTRYSAAVNHDYAAIKKIHDQSSKLGSGFTCPKYTGPQLAWMVVACNAPDGSYWAVQSWQRLLPDYGVKPNPTQSAWEVHLSHWQGPLPSLTINTDWAWHQWDHLFGTFTYGDNPVFGFKSTSVGAPLDTFGRNVYVDTFDSKYGPGWTRENSFLTHTGTGVFCYSFNPHAPHPAGNGSKYRATILGPGVTPDVMWEGTPPGPYDKALDATANEAIAGLHDNLCKPN